MGVAQAAACHGYGRGLLPFRGRLPASAGSFSSVRRGKNASGWFGLRGGGCGAFCGADLGGEANACLHRSEFYMAKER